MIKNNKGFTLIELLVVIAIIGILSATVLASLSSARSKANDAKVKAQLSSIRAAAETYYSTNSNYGTGSETTCNSGFWADPTSGLGNLTNSTNYPSGSSPSCATDATGSAWAVDATLSGTTGSWCVDSTGKSQAGVKTGTAC